MSTTQPPAVAAVSRPSQGSASAGRELNSAPSNGTSSTALAARSSTEIDRQHRVAGQFAAAPGRDQPEQVGDHRAASPVNTTAGWARSASRLSHSLR